MLYCYYVKTDFLPISNFRNLENLYIHSSNLSSTICYTTGNGASMTITLNTNKYYLALVSGPSDKNGYSMNGVIKASSSTSWFIHNMAYQGNNDTLKSFFSYSNYILTVTSPRAGGIYVIELR